MIDFNTEELDKLKTSELKRLADYWQRQYLLQKAKRNGLGQIWCPIKKRFYNEDKVQASHFIDRSKMCTRYHENNVWLISEESNVWDAKKLVEGFKSKHHKEYEEFLLEEIGEKNIKELLDLSKNYCIFAKKDYIDIINNFKNG